MGMWTKFSRGLGDRLHSLVGGVVMATMFVTASRGAGAVWSKSEWDG